jgi:hypothetical protein
MKARVSCIVFLLALLTGSCSDSSHAVPKELAGEFVLTHSAFGPGGIGTTLPGVVTLYSDHADHKFGVGTTKGKRSGELLRNNLGDGDARFIVADRRTVITKGRVSGYPHDKDPLFGFAPASGRDAIPFLITDEAGFRAAKAILPTILSKGRSTPSAWHRIGKARLDFFDASPAEDSRCQLSYLRRSALRERGKNALPHRVFGDLDVELVGVPMAVAVFEWWYGSTGKRVAVGTRPGVLVRNTLVRWAATSTTTAVVSGKNQIGGEKLLRLARAVQDAIGGGRLSC